MCECSGWFRDVGTYRVFRLFGFGEALSRLAVVGLGLEEEFAALFHPRPASSNGTEAEKKHVRPQAGSLARDAAGNPCSF